MTVEEHIRAAEHHLTEAFAELRRHGRSYTVANMPGTIKRISTMLLNILGLVREIKLLTR